MKKLTQEERVYNYIAEHGFITSMSAYSDLRITQLGTRIFNLKGDGIKIATRTRRNEHTHWVEYYFPGETDTDPGELF